MIMHRHTHTHTNGLTESSKTECLRRLYAGEGMKYAKHMKHKLRNPKSIVQLLTCAWLSTMAHDTAQNCSDHRYKTIVTFLPRCMECRRGLAMLFLSVCPSVRRSHAWIVTKR